MDRFIYDLDVLKALVDIEISRIGRYEKNEQFAIVFIYSPKIAEDNKNGQIDVASILKEKLRASDVLTSVEKDFSFIFLSETNRKGAEEFLKRIKSELPEETVTGVVTFPENGKTSFELFQKLLEIMKENMLPSLEE
jgi:hypothetical protein